MAEMTSITPPRCGTCRFWDRCTKDTYPSALSDESDLGQCCVDPPRIVDAIAQRLLPHPSFGDSGAWDEVVTATTFLQATAWPVTEQGQRCGRWEAAPADCAAISIPPAMEG